MERRRSRHRGRSSHVLVLPANGFDARTRSMKSASAYLETDMFAEDIAGGPKPNPAAVLALLGLLLIVGYYAVHVAPDWIAGAAHGFPAAGMDADRVRKV